MITQSGSFGCACLYEMERQNMGCSKFANLGNQIDIAFEDVLSFYKEDENTKVICIYLETITEGRKFFEIIKEIVTYKPIIIQKGGKTPLGMNAASSHTGSIASNYNMTKTAIQQAGAILCNNMSDYITSIKTLSYLPVPITEKIGVLTNSGGTAVLFSDCAEEFGLQFAEFSDILIKKISPFLISLVKKINPLDMIASAFQEQYYQISKAMLEDPEIGIVVACSVIPPFLEIKPDDHFLGIIRAWNETGRKKPIIPL
ncbi:MAG: hypothetical protein GY870_17360, partial [archaeon]|nr:hypothetical protein [archaeon]